jgi:septal ring factor EnvC (AmiA/AmiB activator)
MATRPDLPSQPQRAGSRSFSVYPPIVAIAILALAVSALAVVFVSRTAQLNDQRSETARVEAARQSAQADYQRERDSVAELETERNSLSTQNQALKTQVKQLNQQIGSLGGRNSSLEAANNCLNDILAAYNATTLRIQLADAFDNVARGPQCEKVLTSSPR